MEPIESSETSAYNNTLTPETYPKEKKLQFRKLSVQPGFRGSNDLRIEPAMATFQLLFQSVRAKDLSAPLYILYYNKCYKEPEVYSTS